MNDRRSQSRHVTCSIWLVVFLIAGCSGSKGSRVELKVTEAGVNFEISLRNESDQPIVVHEHLVGGPGEPPVVIEIKDSSGEIVHRCTSLDYFAKPRNVVVAPRGGSETLLVPVSAVSLTHCLKRGDVYLIRVGFVALSGDAQYSKWSNFRADFNVAKE